MLQHDSCPPPASLDDDALTQKVISLVGNEREALVDFLHHLGEFDARRLYLGQGYSSLFEYCSDFLRLSNGTAHRRYTTARLMRRFPLITDFLRSGRLNTKRVALLRDVLTEQNHAEILERATHGTEKDVERLVATLNPKPKVPDGIRRLPSPRPLPAMASSEPMPVLLASSTSAAPRPPETMSAPAGARTLFSASDSLALAVPPPPTAVPDLHQAEELAVGINAEQPAPAMGLLPLLQAEPYGDNAPSPSTPRTHRMDIEATTGTTFSVRMSVGPEFVAEFEEVKAALSHKFPNGNFEAVMRECFRITLTEVKRRRTGGSRKLRLTDGGHNAPRRRRLADGRAGAEVGAGRPFM